MPLRFFLKDQAMVPVFDSATGKPIAFEPLAGGWGCAYFATNNAEHVTIIQALDEFIAKKTGGVSEVSREDYFEFKKKGPFQQAQSPLLEPVRAVPHRFNPNKRDEAAVGVNPVRNPLNLAPRTIQPGVVEGGPLPPVSPAHIVTALRLAQDQAPATTQGTEATSGTQAPAAPAAPTKVSGYKPKLGKARARAVSAAKAAAPTESAPLPAAA